MITDPTMLSSDSGSVKGVAGGICAPMQGPHDKLNKYPKAQTGRTPAGMGSEGQRGPLLSAELPRVHS